MAYNCVASLKDTHTHTHAHTYPCTLRTGSITIYTRYRTGPYDEINLGQYVTVHTLKRLNIKKSIVMILLKKKST